jgi:hypothetical protein
MPCYDFLNRSYKAEASATHGLDETLFLTIVTDRRARGVNARGHGGFGNDPPLPHSGQQFVFAHHAFVVADQISQQLKHLGFDRHFFARAP